MPLVLPQADQVGTIIVEDVGRLDMAAQMYLLEWLESAVPRARVISTSAMPVLPMVAAGMFDATLYYRLNLLYVRC
jgi:DNA-binding NtrC family response regulator